MVGRAVSSPKRKEIQRETGVMTSPKPRDNPDICVSDAIVAEASEISCVRSLTVGEHDLLRLLLRLRDSLFS